MTTSYNGQHMIIDAGSNELQIMEFTIDGRSFGINVAKVLEIMQYSPVTPIPHTSPYVEGVFKPRNKIITVVDLCAYLKLPPSEDTSRDIMIITEFNTVTTAFHVHSVELIRKISWSNLEKPDKTIYNGIDSLIVGIARMEDRLITILDFEKILSDIIEDHSFDSEVFNTKKYEREIQSDIFVVEDSPFLTQLILNCLNKAGYKNISIFSNGLEAWNQLVSLKNLGQHHSHHVSCIITDIEMPQMDGYTLLKNIKDDPALRDIPVVIFSSLISENMRYQGENLGASAQISKPEIIKLVSILDKLVIGCEDN